MNSLVQVGQGRFTNSVAVRARPAPASPAVLQMLAQSIATLNDKINALAERTSGPPARILVESHEIAPMPLAARSFPLARAVDNGHGDPAAFDESPRELGDAPRISLGRILSFFD